MGIRMNRSTERKRKGSIYGLKRKIIVMAGLPMLGLILPLVLIITMFGGFLSSATESFANDYKQASEEIGSSWHDILAFDTVRYNNELDDVDPFVSAMEFMVVEYHKYKPKVDPETGEKTWILIGSDTLDTIDEITDFFGVTHGANVSDVINSMDQFEMPRPWEFNIYSKTIEDVMEAHHFDEEQQEWIGVLLTEGLLAAQFGDDLPDFIGGSGSGYFAWPLPGISEDKATSSYGMRIHPVTGERKFHYGTDIGCPVGTPVIAVAEGTVRSAGSNGGTAGTFIIISHEVDGRTWTTKYFHLSTIKVSQGQQVERGTVIAASGATGRVTGPHLHIETLCNGQYQNPLQLITGH